MRMFLANNCWPRRSFRKLVLRAIEAPLTAPTRWPTSDPATRGSNTTGTLQVSTLRGLARATVRSPARAADAFGRRQIGRMRRRRCNRSRAPCRCRRRRSPSSRCPGSSADRSRGSRWTGHQHHAADAGRGRRAARFGHALDGKRRRLRLRRRGARVPLSRARSDRADRDRGNRAPAARDRRGRHICRRARRAPSRPRARRAWRRRRR